MPMEDCNVLDAVGKELIVALGIHDAILGKVTAVANPYAFLKECT